MKTLLCFLLFFTAFLLNVNAQILPWKTERPLKDFAKESFIQKSLHPTNPQPDVEAYPRGPSLQLLNPSIRSTIWGPADKVTISLIKNDVWDRRITPKKFTAPTLQEITEGAFAEVNKDYSDLNKNSTRPQWGYLRKEGGKFNPYLDITRYPFPMMKKVGQIIWFSGEFASASQPEVTQCMANAKTEVRLENNGKKGTLEYVLGMKRNTYSLRASWNGLSQPVTLRLYRNKDTGFLKYMTPDGKQYISNDDASKERRLIEYRSESAWNGPIEAPTAGRDGNFCWIRQKLPAEKTFPNGFEYVMMAYIPDLQRGDITVDMNRKGLGTPSPQKEINEIEGAAASWTFTPLDNQKAVAFVTIVTTIDAGGEDVMTAAKKELLTSAKLGFDGIVAENENWYVELYDKRENGRIFYGTPDEGKATENMKDVYYSWFCTHDGATNTNMQKYQASAHYVVPELDIQPYAGLPCYNEVFYTPFSVRNRDDQAKMWKQLIMQWADAGRKNAKEMFDMPGLFITHGFLPPIKPDKYVHTNVALELAVETMAQIIKPWWDEWDYTGDINVLKELYPYMKDMALFYAAYAKKGEDGVYHIIPSMQEESFGIQPRFSHSKDCIAAICMFNWAFQRTAEAAKVLGKDENLRKEWLNIAGNLPSYPTWEKPEGKIFAALPGIEPWRGAGEHPWYVGIYPTVLSDDINLDSDESTKQTMLLTNKILPAGLSRRANVLLGSNSDSGRGNQNREVSPGKIEEPESLLNSRSGRIYLFPCLNPDQGIVAFRNFQARGGFLVSACFDGKEASYVEITARRNVPCLLMNPWKGRQVQVIEAASGKEVASAVDNSNGECLVFSPKTGKTYLVQKK